MKVVFSFTAVSLVNWVLLINTFWSSFWKSTFNKSKRGTSKMQIGSCHSSGGDISIFPSALEQNLLLDNFDKAKWPSLSSSLKSYYITPFFHSLSFRHSAFFLFFRYSQCYPSLGIFTFTLFCMQHSSLSQNCWLILFTLTESNLT